MKKDLLVTYVSEAITLAAGVGVYKLSALNFSEENFAVYALFRRVISFVQPVLLIGLAVALPRFISLSEEKDSTLKDSFAFSGLIILGLSFLFFAILSLLYKPDLSILFFGNESFQNLIIPLLIYVLGILIHSYCYSFFRGKLKMMHANALQIINLGIVPLVSFFNNSVDKVILINGILLCSVSGIVLLFVLMNIRPNVLQLLSCSRQLFFYGVQRVPGDISMAVLFLIPASITTYFYGIKEGGYVAFSITMINMLSTFYSPVSILILPHAGKLLASGNIELLKSYIMKILKWAVVSSLAIIIFLEIFIDTIIHYYLGSNYVDSVSFSLRIILAGGIFMVIFVTMRGVIDAYYHRGINAVNQILALLAFCILSAAGQFVFKTGYIFTLIAFVISISILGIFTLWEITKIFRKMNSKRTYPIVNES
ncbi:MAG: hypothetical protein HY063_13030 [Bacteroidetes bacterium]|nr:hypothetical protein [Bacteroidota bacterium]